MSAEFDFKAYLGKAKERVEAALDGSLGPGGPSLLGSDALLAACRRQASSSDSLPSRL